MHSFLKKCMYKVKLEKIRSEPDVEESVNNGLEVGHGEVDSWMTHGFQGSVQESKFGQASIQESRFEPVSEKESRIEQTQSYTGRIENISSI